MNFVPRAAKISPRLIAVCLIITLVSTVGLAYNWDGFTSFARESLSASFKTENAAGNRDSKNSALVEDFLQSDAPLAPGTCETAGPIEVEGSIAGTTPTAYATLAAAFAAINAGTHTGAITVDVCGDTTEPAAGAILNASNGASSYTSIAIAPAGGAARTISGAATAGVPLVDFSGADNVTINGLNTGGNALTISNTTASATTGTSTIRFVGGATNNTITNASILGSNSSSVATNGAVIFFSTDSVTTSGNDNNTISNNNIGPAGANLPTKGILCNGSTSTQAIGNSGLLIDNNNIYDYFGAAVTSAGVAVNGGCNTFSITNNRFYQTGTRTWTSGALHTPILMNSSTAASGVQGMTITGNIIGYASNTQTGTYTLTGSTGQFQGIRFIGITGGTISNINNNTIANVSLTGVTSSGTGASSPFTGIHIGGSSFVGNANANNNVIGSQTATGSLTFSTNTTTSTDVYGIYNIASDAWTSNGNSIGGISVTNAAASGTFIIYGMRANTGSATLWTANSNNIGGTVANSISLNATGASSQVIGMGATTAPSSFTGNTIRNLTSNIGTGTAAAASVIGINVTTSTPNHTLSQNTIYNLSNSHATAATIVTGIQFTGGTANVVERNQIYGLTSATVSTGAEINGIRIAGGTTTYRNNMIALGANVSNAIGTAATGGVSGILEALGTNNIFHNSIYIGGSPTAGAGPSFAFNGQQTTNARSFRDNIFYNARSNGGATGKNYVVRVGGSVVNPSGLTINNNVYFSSGAGAVFGFYATADVADLTAWRAAVGQDANSYFSNPQFLDPANAVPDLHLHPTNSTVAEGNGADVGVATDFDGQTRSGLTPVDIGADAGNFAGIDLAPPSIVYATLGNTTQTTNRTLNVTIADSTGVATGGLAPRIYFNKNAGAYSSTACSLTGGTTASGTWSCAIDNALIGGVVAADVVRYFVVAQDTLGNLAANPGAGFTGTDVNNYTTTPTTPNQYTIVGAVSGTKTVCAAGCDYATLTGANGVFSAINTQVVTGNVNIEINGDLTTGEDGSVGLNPLTEEPAGSNFTVRIYPTGGMRSITGSSATSLIRLNAADRVTIDGSLGGAGTDRSLTVTNTSTGTSSAVIWLQSNGADGAQNNAIKNLNVVGQASTTTLFGIGAGSGTIALGSAGAGNNNNTIQNNSVSKTQFGIHSGGASAASKNTGNVITQNLINAASPNNVARGGIMVFFENNIQITGNTVSGVAMAGSPDVFGISLGLTGISTTTFTGSEVTNATVAGNIVGSVRNTGTFSACGICVAPATSGTNLIANNALSGVSANGTGGDFSVGILVGGGAGSTTNIYYNSVSMNGTQTGGSDKSYALAVGGSNPVVDIRNNALYNVQNNGTGANYAIAFGYSTFTNLTSNNNDLFVTAPSTIHFAGATGSLSAPTNQSTLAALQTATGKDANSISADPLFNNPANNLQPQTVSPLIGAGTAVSVTTDINGAVRNGATPTIGAYENGLDTAGPAIAYTALGNTTGIGNRTLGVTLTDGSGVPTSGIGLPVIYYRKNAEPWASTQCSFASGSSYSCDIVAASVGGFAQGDTVQYYVAAQDNLGNVSVSPAAGAGGLTANPPAAATPPSAPSSYLISVSYTGTLTVDGVGGSGNFASLTNAGGVFAALNAGVLTGNVTINISADLTGETGSVALNQMAEEPAGSNFTVTIKPTGAAHAITSTASAPRLIALNGADRVTIDGSLAGGSDRSLTLSNINTASGTTVVSVLSLGVGAGATNNTIKNAVIQNGSTLNTGSTANFGIFVGDASGAAAGADNDNMTIQNNQVKKTSIGIQAAGVASTGVLDNLTIAGNTFGDDVLADSIGRYGVFVSQASGANVTGNTIKNVTSTNSGIAASNNVTGIVLSAGTVNSSVTRNIVTGVRYASTGGYGGKGIDVSTGNATSNLTIANNFISDIRGDGWNDLNGDSIVGLRIGGTTGGVNVYNNSVYLGSGNFAGNTSGTQSAAFFAASGTTNLDVRNNVFASNLDNTAATTDKTYAIATNATTAAPFTSVNYNDYFVTGTPGIVGTLNAVDRATLAGWQTASGQDANSLATDPQFASATDLHISATSPAIDAGATIAAVTLDIDGQTRPSGAGYDLGADEIAVAPAGTVQFSAATYSVGEGGGTVTLTVTRTGGSNGAVTVNYSLGGGTATGGAACGGATDYVNTGGSVNFADGDAADKTFSVAICDDATFESADETFDATLAIGSGSATLGTPNAATVTIGENDAQPSVQFTAATSSTSEGTGMVAISVSRAGASGNAISVDYGSVAGGTATAGASCSTGVDYVAPSGTLSWASGDAADKSLTVILCDDSLFESSETVNLALSNPVGATLGMPVAHTLTINENDSAPVFQFSSPTYTNTDDIAALGKGDQAVPEVASITVTRTGALENAVAVNYATASGGTATAGMACGTGSGVDYLAASGTLNFAAGETMKTFSVTVCTDSLYEGDETVNLALSMPAGGAVLGMPSAAVLTIVDNDSVPSLQFSSATYTNSDDIARFGATTDQVSPSVATVTVTRTGAVDNAVAVNYSTASGGTATGGMTSCATGVDYISTSGTLNFAAGVVSQTFNVTVCTDNLFEGDETVNLLLSMPAGGAMLGMPNAAVLTITDNDAAPSVQFSAATYSVGEGGGSATVTVTRTGAVDNAVAVNYATANGTATGGASCGTGVDYLNASGSLSFAAGETSKTFGVSVCDDASAESSETVNLALSMPAGGAVLGAQNAAVLTIVDNDAAPSLQFSSATYTAGENLGTITLTVTRSGATGNAVAVDYATGGGTATTGACAPGVDYNAASGTLNFAAGDTSKTFVVAICNDAVYESNQTFDATLTNPTGGGTLGTPNPATVTIDNDDAAPNVVINDLSQAEGNSGTSSFQTTFTVTGASEVGGVFALATANDTATAGSDYISFSIPNVVVPANVNRSTETLNGAAITVNGDTAVEADETFFLNASSCSNCSLTDNQGVATILNDDASVQFSSSAYTVGEGGGSATITVTRSGFTGGGASVNYATLNGTATGGASCAASVDYVNASGTLSFAVGETSKTFNVSVCDDAVLESSETVDLQLSAPSGATLGSPGAAVLTITDNDGDTTAPTLSYTPLSNVASIQNRTISVTATDNVGVQSVTVTWFYDGTASGLTNGCTFQSGTAQNGTWSCLLVGVAGAPTNPGTVTYYVRAFDTSGNSAANPSGANAANGTRNLYTVGSNGTINVTTTNAFENVALGNGFSLNGNATVTGNLTLSGGILNTGGNTLTLECGATVTGGGESNYIVGNLEKRFCVMGTFTFPVGAAFALPPVAENDASTAPEGIVSNYSPLTVNILSGDVGSSLTVSVTDGLMAGTDPTNSLSRYWSLTETGQLTADLTFTYRNEDVIGSEAAYNVLRRSGGTANYPGGTVNAAANTFTAPAVSDFSQWSAGIAVPTAANAEISGRVVLPGGAGVRNATVVLSGGTLNAPVYAQTGAFGNYRFEGLPVGQTYVVTVLSKRYSFANPTRIINLNDSVTEENFEANEQ